jgi:sugar lactone lactonase YvrE
MEQRDAVCPDGKLTAMSKRRSVRRVVAALLVSTAAALLYWDLHRRPATQAGWAARAAIAAGDGTLGYADGTAHTARFADPFGVVVDPHGRIYVSDGGENNRIRRIDPDGLVSTIAGGREGFADGLAGEASFNTPSGLALDALGNLYVADTGNHAIRRVAPDGRVTTVAGDGVPGDVDGPGPAARFNGPVGVAVDRDGRIFVADSYNDRIRRIDTNGQVTTIAGGEAPGYQDGVGGEALFDTPCGIAVLPSGDLLVADTGNGLMRIVSDAGTVRTLGSDHSTGVVFAVAMPVGLAVSHDGFIYVSGYRDGRIVQITPGGGTHPLARGVNGSGGEEDERVRFLMPAGLSLDPEGGLVVADTAQYLVRRLHQRNPPLSHTARLGRWIGAWWQTTPGSMAAVAREDWVTDDGMAGIESALMSLDPFPWPVDPQTSAHEVVGTMGEVRGTDTDRRARLHGGVDIRAPMGATVRAVRDEKVRSPLAAWGLGGDNENIAVDLISYVHIKVGRTQRDTPLPDAPFLTTLDDRGRVARVRVRRGERFRVGDPLGTVNRLFHVHLELGAPGVKINPFRLPFVGLTDTRPPVIVRDGIRLYDWEGHRLTERRRGRLVVRGAVRITLEAYDQVDGNAPRRRLGLYGAGYQILHPDGTPVPGFEQPRITIEFNRLPPHTFAGPLVYADESGIAAQGHPVTRFVYALTNTVRDGRIEPGLWDSSSLPAGDYTLRVFAADYWGNVAVSNRDLPITVEEELWTSPSVRLVVPRLEQAVDRAVEQRHVRVDVDTCGVGSAFHAVQPALLVGVGLHGGDVRDECVAHSEELALGRAEERGDGLEPLDKADFLSHRHRRAWGHEELIVDQIAKHARRELGEAHTPAAWGFLEQPVVRRRIQAMEREPRPKA